MFKFVMLWLVSCSVMGNPYDWRNSYRNAYTYDPYRNLIVKPRYIKPIIVRKIIDKRYRADAEKIEVIRQDCVDECEFVEDE